MSQNLPVDLRAHPRLRWIQHCEQVTKMAAPTCRYFGISRGTFYFWYHRYLSLGIEGLKNKSCRPHKIQRWLPKPHYAESDLVTVRPHFRKLPQGWQTSEQQIHQAILETGTSPPRGYTFVGEAQRGFPGVPLPYQEARDAWEVHRQLAPSLVISEDYAAKLLEQIPSFG